MVSRTTARDLFKPPDDDFDEDAPGENGASSEGDDEMFAGLSHGQSLAVMALLSEPSLERAAQKAGTCARSLHRWMEVPAFQRAYRLARRHAFNQAVGVVVKYTMLAVSTMVEVMADKDASPSARVSASSSMLKFGRDGIQLDDITARLEAIEAALTSQQQSIRPPQNEWKKSS